MEEKTCGLGIKWNLAHMLESSEVSGTTLSIEMKRLQ
jgi:hypothetical protein